MLIVRKGPTSHLPLHTRTPDTIEIPPTEILGRIFITPLGGREKLCVQLFFYGKSKNPVKDFCWWDLDGVVVVVVVVVVQW